MVFQADDVHSTDESSDDGIDAVERQGHEDWCLCSLCTDMPTVRERLCCFDLEECGIRKNEAITVYNMDLPYDCITQHPGYINNCLLWEVLENAWLAYKQQYGANAYTNDQLHKRYRHVAYRQLARFLYGIVGRYVRYVLPACAIKKIRERIPNPNDNAQYIGFVELFQ